MPQAKQTQKAEDKKQEQAEGKQASPKVDEQTAGTQAASKLTDTAEEKTKVPEKFQEIVSAIEKMSVLDLAELIKVLEERLGVSAQAPVAAAAPAAAAVPGVSEEGGSGTVTVQLSDAGASKIQVIKVVKELTGKGLKEAKDLVEGAPVEIKSGVPREEAEQIKKQLEEAGATVQLI